jgi:hypothetical protein
MPELKYQESGFLGCKLDCTVTMCIQDGNQIALFGKSISAMMP